MDSWDAAEKWYSGCVGKEGHYYHQAVILPRLLPLLELDKKGSLLDLGCGQGVLARYIPKSLEYLGIDASKELVKEAKKLSKEREFIVADASKELPTEKRDFDAACFLLSFQNMEDGEGAIRSVAKHLKVGGRLVLILNHPCFRIPRQSSWGIDEKMKLQYRRVNGYMSSQKIPIQISPGNEKLGNTYSYHNPLSAYSLWLRKAGFMIGAIEEWCSDKKSEGAKARMEDRARREIPLFLALKAIKLG
jgi:SAM-dependent methyltransferase